MKKMFLMVLLMLSGLLMSSCVKVVMRFNPDGSGRMEFGFNMSVQNAQSMSAMSGEEPDPDMDILTEMLTSGEPQVDEETGITFSAVERLENGSIWTYMIAEIPNIEAWSEVEAAGERVFPEEESADTEDDEEEDSPTEILAVPTITVDGSTLTVEVIVPAQGDAEAEADPMSAAMSGIMQMSYEIEMPGILGEHNGQIDTLTGNPVWLLDPTSTEPLEIKVESTVE
jgi:hypothetical protein